MSVLNKMLQDLHRRQALESAPEASVLSAGPANTPHREWFWRTVTLLLAISVAWVLWIAYHIVPQQLATDEAFHAAGRARALGGGGFDVPVVPAAVEVFPMAPKRAEEPAPAKQPRAALKLALAIETPIREPVANPAAAPAFALKLALEIETPIRLRPAGGNQGSEEIFSRR
ncbi:MAG TPA: hypothetical protein VFC18_13060 [Burkholderiales bacterium]|nr:hypothetical protein [Burkholderiales bacterium]